MTKGLAVFIILTGLLFSQTDTVYTANWNLENLFDTMNDPLTYDDDFLEGSGKNWTEEKLDHKLRNVAGVIREMNGGKGPDIIGFQEVEHEYLLIRLNQQYLKGEYGIAYLESKDMRGIDNALLYRSDKFRLVSLDAHEVLFDDDYVTRYIIQVDLRYKDSEIIHCFVNHWPSRRGGRSESEPRRIRAAATLRSEIERIFMGDLNANILIIGDFNDDPDNISLVEYLDAGGFDCISGGSGIGSLYNLAVNLFETGIGTYLYKEEWNMLDQIIVSPGMIDEGGFEYICDSFEVFKPARTVTNEGRFKGAATPTYGGNNYLGGYSDHFPVGAKFIYGGE